MNELLEQRIRELVEVAHPYYLELDFEAGQASLRLYRVESNKVGDPEELRLVGKAHETEVEFPKGSGSVKTVDGWEIYKPPVGEPDSNARRDWGFEPTLYGIVDKLIAIDRGEATNSIRAIEETVNN